MKNTLIAVILILISIPLVAHAEPPQGERVVIKPSPFELTKKEADSGLIKYYGEGFYQFLLTGDTFGYTYAAFRRAHPDLEPVTMTGNIVRLNDINTYPIPRNVGYSTYADYGAAVGYFVIFRVKEKK